MKKFLIASVAVSLMRNIALGQGAPSASASTSPSPAGTEETERVIVQSQEMDITREQLCRVSVPLAIRLDLTVSAPKRKVKTRHLTKLCCVSPVSRRIRSDSFTSAANMQIS